MSDGVGSLPLTQEVAGGQLRRDGRRAVGLRRGAGEVDTDRQRQRQRERGRQTDRQEGKQEYVSMLVSVSGWCAYQRGREGEH